MDIKKIKIDESFPVGNSLLAEIGVPFRSEVVGFKFMFWRNCSYNSHKTSVDNYLLALSNLLDVYSLTCAKIVILGHFNVGAEDNYMKLFRGNYLKSLAKQSTCYKNSKNLIKIDFILTNVPWSFQSTCFLKQISNFHLMTPTVIRKR